MDLAVVSDPIVNMIGTVFIRRSDEISSVLIHTASYNFRMHKS